MFDNDAQIKAHALLMWANYIETGHVTTSGQDAVNSGREKSINALNQSQQEFVVKLRRLSSEELNKDYVSSKTLQSDLVNTYPSPVKSSLFRRN